MPQMTVEWVHEQQSKSKKYYKPSAPQGFEATQW